jgi:hypothetical protein
MFVARQFPLLAVFLLIALGGPELAAAEPAAPAGAAAVAAESVASDAPTVAATATAVEVAPPPAEATPPPPTSTEAEAAAAPPAGSAETAASPPSPTPTPRPRETVERVATGVDSAAWSSLPPERQQQLAGVTQEAQQEPDGAVEEAAGRGDEALRAATDVARQTGDRPGDASRPVRDVVSTVLGSAKTVLGSATDGLISVGAIEPALLPSPPSIPPSRTEHPPIAPSNGSAMPTPPGPGPAATPLQASDILRAPTMPVGVPIPQGEEGKSGSAVFDDASSSLPRLGGPIASPPTSDGSRSAGASSPAVPSLPNPSLPDALDAVTPAPGGTGSGLPFALLALSLLLVPTFASKLRMHAGDCRPAPFVSLLERPG